MLALNDVNYAFGYDELAESEQKQIIDNVAKIIEKSSVYPRAAIKVKSQLTENLNQYIYLGYEEPLAFAERITLDLQDITNDPQLVVTLKARAIVIEDLPEENAPNSVELLDGNVALVTLNLNAKNSEIDAVFTQLKAADVLMLDLRDQSIENLSAIQYFTSYLFEKKTLIESFYHHETKESEQLWTKTKVAGVKRPDIPMYILTNNATAKSGELLATRLKQLKRAYIVGEQTAGDIHLRKNVVVGHGLYLSIASAEATQASQQKLPLKPDLLVVSFLAFKESYPMAKHSAVKYRVKQGRGTPQETYSINRDKITYADWQFYKGACLIKYRLAEPLYNANTEKFQFPFQVMYYGKDRVKMSYQLGGQNEHLTQKISFEKKGDIRTGVSQGFRSHNKPSILGCKKVT